MNERTLLRVLLRVLGLFFLGVAAPSLVAVLVFTIQQMFAASPDSDMTFFQAEPSPWDNIFPLLLSLIGPTLQAAFGLYLLFGARLFLNRFTPQDQTPPNTP